MGTDLSIILLLIVVIVVVPCHSRIPKYVRDQLLSAVSLITKRSLFDISDQDKQAIILHIKQLLAFDSESAVSERDWLGSTVGLKCPFIANTRCIPWKCLDRSILKHEVIHGRA